MEDRRLFKRATFDHLVRCNIVKNDGALDAITGSINISGGGICLDGARLSEYSKDCDLVMELSIPGYRKTIPARGEIVWDSANVDPSSDEATGVRFIDIDNYDRQMILDYVHFG